MEGNPNMPYAQSNNGGKWVFRLLVGCASVGLLCVIGCGVLGVFGYRYAAKQVQSLAAEYTSKGYESQMGQVITVGTSPATPTVYIGQMVTVTAPVNVDIAIVAQVGQIKADINGNLDFKGQMLTIHPNTTITGDLTINAAQVVEIQGKVEGEISGSYQVLRYGGKTYGNSQPVQSAPSQTQTRDFELGGIKLDEETKQGQESKQGEETKQGQEKESN